MMIETQEAATSATTVVAGSNNTINSSGRIDTTNGITAGMGSGGGTNGRIESVGALCRICMCGGDGRLLESLSRTTVESKSLYAMLVSVCSPLAQANNEGMPDKICGGCKGKLVQAYKLYETCIKSDEKIRKLLQSQTLFGGVQVKQEVIDDEDDDVQLLTGGEPYYEGNVVKREDPYDQGAYMYEGHPFLGGATLAPTMHSTPNFRIQSVRNGPEVLAQFQDHSFPPMATPPPKPTFQYEKLVKVTPKGHHCTLCGKDFKYFSYFKQHALAQHDPEKPFKCDKCKYTFKTEQRLYIHMRTHIEPELPPAEEHAELPEPPEAENDPEPEPELDQLDETLDEEDRKNLKVTLNRDTGEKVYTCQICQKQLTTLPLYRRHRTVHSVKGRPFECDICHYRFAAKFSYNAHMQRHEEGIDPAQPATYKCTECDEVFPKRKLLNIHIAAEHDSEEPLSKTAPATMFTSTLSEGRNGHVCPICSETFNRESVLNNHMKTHELEAAQMKHSEICYACTVCGVECESREIFDDHIKTHSDIQFTNSSTVDVSDDEQSPQNGSDGDPLAITPKPTDGGKPVVKCELCHKTFPYACNLKQHKIIHHSEMKPHECNVCHYRFEYEGTLLRHMQKHSKSEQQNATASAPTAPPPSAAEDATTIVAPPGATLIYKCKLCSARFQKQKSMTWHLKTHRSIVTNEGTSVQNLEQILHSPPPKGVQVPQAASSPISVAAAAPADIPSRNSSGTTTSSSATNAFTGGNVEPKSPPSQSAKMGAMYKCSYCPQNLDSEEAYYQHLKGHRVRPNPSDDGDSPQAKKKRMWVRSGDHHKCNLCHKVFTFRSQLQQHTALHHQPGKPYECSKCHYSFVHKLNLKRHELTHLEEERLANEEDEDPIKLLEDENFNASMEEMVEPEPDEESITTRSNQQEASETTQPSSGEGGTTGKRNKCVVCAALFQREDQLIEHLKTHIERIKTTKQDTQTAKRIFNDDTDRKCKLCSKVFKFTCQLKQHLQMHHSKDKPFECNICKYRFEFKGHMIRHKANNHADELAAEEEELPSKITTPVVNPDGSEVFQCPVCPMNFIKQRSLTWHLKTHSGRRLKQEDGYPSTSSGEVMQCRFCSRTFRDVYELKAHMVTHIGSSGGGHNASMVDSEHSLFGSGLEMMLQDFPDSMENHGGDPLFDTSNLELVLEDGFVGHDDLDFGMRYHHDTPPLPPAKRSLPAVNDSSSSVYDVAEPGATTTPAKGKIVCDLCKKDFLYACNLKQHMQLHHAKEKPFECKICFYRFEYSGHLVRHVRQIHDGQGGDGAAGDSAADKSFVCTFCSELFEQKGQLNAHMQTQHRGEKQFKCDSCPAAFTYKKSYDTHREEHHSNKRPDSDSTVTASTSAGNTTFSCNFCKKKFSSAQKVDNHVCFQ